MPSQPDQPINDLPGTLHDEIEKVVQASLNDVFPAASLSIIKDGAVRLNAVWGVIDPETRRYPTQTSTRFDLASLTKIFTVSAFLSLMSAKGISLDHPLVTLVPEFGETGPRLIDGGQDPHTKIRLPTPDAVRGKRADPRRVTFRHLLTHTSGLAPWRDVYNAAGPTPTPPHEPDPLSRQQRWSKALQAICQYAFVGEPGQGIVRYSDLGLMLLGEATARLYDLEKTAEDMRLVSARQGASPDQFDLEDAIYTRVLAPLNLQSVTFNPVRHGIDRSTIAPTENDPTWRKRRVWGEVHDENACGVGGAAGHAGLFGTAHDVAALGQAWLENDPRLNIPAALMDDAKREHVLHDDQRRGLGWVVKAVEDSSAGDLLSMDTFGHTGFTGTSLWIDPQRALVVALLTNSVYPGREHGGTHEFRRAMHTAIAQMF